MNYKTTWLLAVALAVLGGFYYTSQSARRAESTSAPAEPPLQPGTSEISQSVLEEDLADIVKVVCTPRGKDAWVFEKDGEKTVAGQDHWRMTSPLDMTVMAFEVQRIATQLTNIKYDVSYGPGAPISEAKAGLDPPEAVFVLTDENGKTATFEIGRAASPMETYLRLAGSDRIVVGKGELASLVKPNALSYREQQVWRFVADDVMRIEIDAQVDGQPTHIVFAKHRGEWMLESPVTAKAVQAKVMEMARTLSNMRFTKWVDHDADHLRMYGLAPSAITVRATVEVEMESEAGEGSSTEEAGLDVGSPEKPPSAADADKEPGEATIETKMYILHISSGSPIGEESKVYVRADDESMAGTLMKTIADRFVPQLPEWREMKLSPVNATTASQIGIETPQGHVALRRGGRAWAFEDGAKADDVAVRELLVAINALTAVRYVDADSADLARFGLAEPQAVVRLTLPGVVDGERIRVGAFTDPNSKRMVYVQRNERRSIAKIRIGDVAKLLRDPRTYRDRSIVDLDAGRITQLTISTRNACTQGNTSIVIRKNAGAWSLASPVEAELNEPDFKVLLDRISDLTAEAIVADGSEASAYGLHDPAVSIAITYDPPKTVRLVEPSDDEGGGGGGAGEGDDTKKEMNPVEVQPPPETVTLLLTEHDGQVYAKRAGVSSVFRVAPEVLRLSARELRSGVLLTPDKETVSRFAIRNGTIEHGFRRKDKRWVYEGDADLPLDDKKVENLLLQLGDLRTIRFVSHTDVADLSVFGLAAPKLVVTMADSAGRVSTLNVSGEPCSGDETGGFYATVSGQPGVFLLTPDDVARLQVDLASLER